MEASKGGSWITMSIVYNSILSRQILSWKYVFIDETIGSRLKFTCSPLVEKWLDLV